MQENKSFDETLNAVPVPEISDAPDTVVNLICGINTGVSWETKAVVREMNGEDEELLSEASAKTSFAYPEYVLSLLKRTVVSIGEVDIQKNPDALNELLVGDRDLLLLGVVKATYGKTRDFKVKCPHCSESNDLIVDMDEDFKIEGDTKTVRDPIVVKLRNGNSVKFRRPNALDSRSLVALTNTAQQNTMMIARCVTDSVPAPSTLEWAKKMSVADRSAVITAMLEAKVGPVPQEVDAPCASCSKQIQLSLDWVSLLFG